MNKKRLALVGVVTALIIVIVAVLFFQLLTQNNASNATAKADSFELHIKDIITNYQAPSNVNAPNFSRNDNATALAEFKSTYSNLTVVSETTFLDDLNNFMPTSGLANGLYESCSIVRTGNTFFLVTLYDDYNVAVPQYTSTCVSYTP